MTRLALWAELVKRRETLAAAVLLTFLAGCGKPPTTPGDPEPTPSASPSARPSSLTPLSVEGDRFVANGEPVHLFGAIVCCEGYPANGWPLVSEQMLELFEEHGVNFTHVRLGPFTARGESPEFVAYATDPTTGKLDLTKWNPAFWAKVRSTLSAAHHRGIYVEVDLIDGWLRKYPEIAAWGPDNNVQGESHTGRPRGGLSATERRWVEKILEETASFPNVLYQDGNELFLLRPSRAYVEQLADLVHGRGRLLGTNTHDPAFYDLADYVQFHTSEVPRPTGLPTMVNEYDWRVGALDFEERLRKGYERGVAFHLWRGGMQESEWLDALGRLKKFRAEVSQ